MPSSNRTVVARVVSLALAALVLGSSRIAAQTPAPRDPEAGDVRPAPVLIEGEPILWISYGSGPYTTQYRAERISQRIMDAVHDRSIRDPTVAIVENEGSSELRTGPRLLMVVTPGDAASLRAARATVAQQYATIIEQSIRIERLRYAPATLLKSGAYGLVATLIFAGMVWIILRITGAFRRRARRSEASSALAVLQDEVLQDDRVARLTRSVVFATRVVLVLIAFDLYLTFVLGLFPWTRAVSHRLLDYGYAPIRAVGAGLIAYLPKLLFLIVIAAVFYGLIKLVGVFFRSIERGRLVFANFPAEWADPTNTIARVLLIAFGLVVAFPYLPASDSPAFAGVSVFLGVLVSLSSSTALSNMIAGLVMTYTGAFRVGDRVRLGDAFGDISEMALLATRVRTIKN